MLDFEKSHVVALLLEQNRLLQDIKAQNEPFTTAEQAKAQMSPLEFEVAKLKRIKMASFGEVIEAVAEARGFDTVQAMLDKDDKVTRVWPKSLNEIIVKAGGSNDSIF